MKKNTNIVASLKKIFLSNSTVFIVQFITTIIFARIFSPYEFGILTIILLIISFSELFLNMGIGYTVIQKKSFNENDINTAFTFSLIMGIITCISIIALSPIISDIFGLYLNDYLKYISLIFLIGAFNIVPQALFFRDLNFNIIFIKDISSILTYSILGISLGVLGFGIWGLVIAIISKYICNSLIIWGNNKHKFRIFISKESFKNILFLGSGQTAADFFNTLGNQGDNLIVSKMLGPVSLGVYSRMYQLGSIVAFIIGQVIDTVLFPHLSKFQNNIERLNNYFLNATLVSFLIYGPIAIVTISFSYEIIYFVLGKDWVSGEVVFVILSIVMFFRLLYKLSDPIFRAIGAVYLRLKTQVFFAISVLIFTYAFSGYGINGIAIGLSISIIINYMVIMFVTNKILKIPCMTYFYKVGGGFVTYIFTIVLVLCFKFYELFSDLFIIKLIMVIGLVLLYVFINYSILPKDVKKNIHNFLR